MKKITALCVLFFVFTTCLHAQKIEKFFDYKWNESPPDMARFYAVIMHTDSGWLRQDYFLAEKKLQMKGLYKDSTCEVKHGVFHFFHPNGILESTGQFTDNRKEGLWLMFHPNGFMKDSSVYNQGEIKGTSLQWHNNGYLSDSTVYKEDFTAVKVSWFDDGALSAAGRLSLDQYHGKWQFFHPNGQLSADEIYNNGKLLTKKYFTEDGTPIADTTDKTKPAVFIGGVPAWLRYLEKKLYWPNYKLVNRDKAEIGVDFRVDENGNVKDVTITNPFHPVFNDIVQRIIKDSPKWAPAISHNRRVSYHHRQQITFKQTTY